ncbi:MAG: aminoglycoside phosphotransferase family protein [Legionellales bacterium]|nr:aminoglycoside phosphotransferase family protein [Legionellales bacterium]
MTNNINISANIDLYKELLNLSEYSKFIHLSHQEAMVATVYKIIQPQNLHLILKISNRLHDYLREKYFLEYFSSKLPVPKIIKVIPQQKNIFGSILMEYLSGSLLQKEHFSDQVAYKIGTILAQIHLNKTEKYGDLTKPNQLTHDPRIYFEKKFNERLNECRSHLPSTLIKKCHDFLTSTLDSLIHTDGPCIIHRDFRPGNIIFNNNNLYIIDWASARASFAEDDFCSIEHGEWKGFSPFKDSFLRGYSSIREIPNYKKIMPLLRLNRALSIIGFLVQNKTWDNINLNLYKSNRKFLQELLGK